MTLRKAAGVCAIGLTLLGAACGGDGDEEVSLDVTAVALGNGVVAINLYNDGQRAGIVHGCPDGAMTAVEQWNGSDWESWGTLNADCMIELELGSLEDMEYTIDLPDGRYRFTVTLIVEGHFGGGTSTSNPVDV